MKILWLTWKDRKHPMAGGAELVNEELAKRLAADGHEVKFIVAGFDGSPSQETIDGYEVIRLGGRLSVYWKAYRYYKKHLQGWPDLVIDEVNTVPFFAKFYVKERNLLFVHMLCRQIWFYQMIFPLSLIGYLLEPVYLSLLNDRKVITVSESTKKDLMRHGFKGQKIHIISEGIEMEPVKDLKAIKKYPKPTLLSLGAIRSMKRTHHQIKAFELAKKDIPELQFKVAGEAVGRYGLRVRKMIRNSRYAEDIEYLGKVNRDKKLELLQRSHLLLMTSVKEGWGLVVTEAASQGTPAVVYDVDGLRDSVKNGKTGSVTENTPQSMAEGILRIFEADKLGELQGKSLAHSKVIRFDTSFNQFHKALVT